MQNRGYSQILGGQCPIVTRIPTYPDENIEGMIIEHVDSPLGMTLAIEGKDNNAADFGSSLLLLLKGMSATKIQATAGTDYWQASWVENVEGMLSITLKEYEE